MEKEVNKQKFQIYLIIKTAILEIITAAAFIAVFAAVMYFLELDKALSPVLATVSVALATLIASFYAAKKIGNKGYLIGLAVGGITFIVITLISFIIDDGGVTSNTLFHFIIIMLSALIGGISGVNKKGRKYI